LNWEEMLEEDLRAWLLDGEPWVVYRTLVDLLSRSDNDEQVVAARKAIPEHPLVKKIFERMNRDGYWGKPKDIHTWWPRKDTTFWILPMLADFGLSVADEGVAKSCEYVLSTQLPSGAFGWDPSDKPGDCHTAIITESLAKLGLLRDPRVARAYEWLVGRHRLDGGFWCKDTARIGGPRQKEPSCAMATMFTVGAFAQNPELGDAKIVRDAVDFLFECWGRRGQIRYAGHDSQIGSDWEKLKYPFTDYKILKFLDALSQFGYVKRRLRESDMVSLLLRKADAAGRFTPESIHKVWADFDFGQKEMPSRWITLLALRTAKRVYE